MLEALLVYLGISIAVFAEQLAPLAVLVLLVGLAFAANSIHRRWHYRHRRRRERTYG